MLKQVQHDDQVDYYSRHPEFISDSHHIDYAMLKQVQHDD
jgi:hypothetical protein